MPQSKQNPKSLSSLVNPYNIKEAAYYKWLQRGCRDGDALKDWFEAELELRAELFEEE